MRSWAGRILNQLVLSLRQTDSVNSTSMKMVVIVTTSFFFFDSFQQWIEYTLKHQILEWNWIPYLCSLYIFRACFSYVSQVYIAVRCYSGPVPCRLFSRFDWQLLLQLLLYSFVMGFFISDFHTFFLIYCIEELWFDKYRDSTVLFSSILKYSFRSSVRWRIRVSKLVT